MNTKCMTTTLVLSLAFCASAHPGRTDSRGGHKEKGGSYHYHNGGGGGGASTFTAPAPATRPATPPAPAPVDKDAVKRHFQNYNNGVDAWRGAPSQNTATATMRMQVLNRDKTACVVCGAKTPLVVDHSRSFLNGGSSTLENLHTLCRRCQEVKAGFDSELYEQRKAAGLVP